MIDKASFMAASTFPSKLLVTNVLKDKKIIPYHIQLYPTNNCNMRCPFCSCSEVDRKQQLTLEQIMKVIDDAKELGTKAVSISGGGEPLIHPDIEKIVKYIHEAGMDIGLVSNGLLLANPSEEFWSYITWCRISSGDHREFNVNYKNILDRAVNNGLNVDWAFSHVLSDKPNLNTISSIVRYANDNDFTHVRIVDDILDESNNISMDKVKLDLYNKEIDDSKVIYQGRKEYLPGIENCLVSLLRPVINPDGFIYPCCGSQYSIRGEERGLNPKYSMGRIEDFKKIFNSQKKFNGSVCYKCYYNNYNSALEIITADLKHKRFI